MESATAGSTSRIFSYSSAIGSMASATPEEVGPTARSLKSRPAKRHRQENVDAQSNPGRAWRQIPWLIRDSLRRRLRRAGSLRCARQANLQFNDLYYQGQKLKRTRGNVSQLDEEFYTFGMPLAGPLAVTQSGRHFEVEPGCVYLMNQSAPYQAVALGQGGYRSLSVSFPRSALAQRDARLESFYKLRVDGGAPGGQLLKSYLDHLLGGMVAWSDAEVGVLGEHLIDLIVLFLVQSQAAQASENDSSVTLAHCQRLLRDPANAYRSIAELAYQSGFAHPSHFSRAFCQRFGVTAREYRAAGGRG